MCQPTQRSEDTVCSYQPLLLLFKENSILYKTLHDRVFWNSINGLGSARVGFQLGILSRVIHECDTRDLNKFETGDQARDHENRAYNRRWNLSNTQRYDAIHQHQLKTLIQRSKNGSTYRPNHFWWIRNYSHVASQYWCFVVETREHRGWTFLVSNVTMMMASCDERMKC